MIRKQKKKFFEDILECSGNLLARMNTKTRWLSTMIQQQWLTNVQITIPDFPTFSPTGTNGLILLLHSAVFPVAKAKVIFQKIKIFEKIQNYKARGSFLGFCKICENLLVFFWWVLDFCWGFSRKPNAKVIF